MLSPSVSKKFTNPFTTINGKERAHVGLHEMATLWFNTGTLCNIECKNCYILSSPKNDSLVYINTEEVRRYLDELVTLNFNTREIAFTGGEPFMNPSMLEIMELTLERGYDLLMLTNAMQPMQRPKIKAALLELQNKYGSQITMRISVDHYTQKLHEEERGKRTWDKTISGIDWLEKNNFNIDIAGRSMWDENEDEARKGFAKLFNENGWNIDAFSNKQLVIFPEMSGDVDTPEITTDCWKILNKRETDVMCSSSRMIVKRKGDDLPTILPCTLLPYDDQFNMGNTLKESLIYSGGAIKHGRVRLNHPNCSLFCMCGGASCSV